MSHVFQVTCSQNQVPQCTGEPHLLQELWAICLLLAPSHLPLFTRGISPQDPPTLQTWQVCHCIAACQTLIDPFQQTEQLIANNLTKYHTSRIFFITNPFRLAGKYYIS